MARYWRGFGRLTFMPQSARKSSVCCSIPFEGSASRSVGVVVPLRRARSWFRLDGSGATAVIVLPSQPRRARRRPAPARCAPPCLAGARVRPAARARRRSPRTGCRSRSAWRRFALTPRAADVHLHVEAGLAQARRDGDGLAARRPPRSAPRRTSIARSPPVPLPSASSASLSRSRPKLKPQAGMLVAAAERADQIVVTAAAADLAADPADGVGVQLEDQAGVVAEPAPEAQIDDDLGPADAVAREQRQRPLDLAQRRRVELVLGAAARRSGRTPPPAGRPAAEAGR